MAHLIHITRDNDRWDIIAWDYYRSVRLQSEIIAANRDLFVTRPATPLPAVLPAGIELRIPVLEEERDESRLPPWKRGAPSPGQSR